MQVKSCLVVVALFLCYVVDAQTVRGVVKDDASGELLFGVAVLVEGTDIGTTTDFDGKFELDVKQTPPFNIQISYLGYEDQVVAITSDNVSERLNIKLKSAAEQVQTVEVTASRISEKQLETPLTVESMNLAAIKETPASSFYNGLGALKGVDLTTASLGFVVVNTRGFNSTRPVRSLQLVDGADNQAPGLNFSLGNFVGASELDIQKVDLVVGASSALYGPNAFNGVINMETKNPFYHRGLSVMVKGGERNLFEGAIRYARKFGKKRDIFAFKVNFSYLRADDWEADNLAPVDESRVSALNFGGYDAVNRYGDENLRPGANDYTEPNLIRLYPGLGEYFRTGYLEKDLVNYDTRNLKANIALHGKITEKVEAIASYNFGTGTTVYQGDNRYSLQGLRFHQIKGEIRQDDKFFIRAYHTRENAGDTYDAVFTALLLQEAVKSDLEWSRDYENYWSRNIVQRVFDLPGMLSNGDPLWNTDTSAAIAIVDSVLNVFSDSLNLWHAETRAYADSVGNPFFDNDPRLRPGTARFDSVFNDIISKTTFEEGGSKFFDESALTHVQAQYKYDVPIASSLYNLNFTVGGNYRLYQPNSRGTIFSDTAGIKITNWEWGAYLGAEQRFVDGKYILNATLRVDKNENFDYLASPAASLIYKVNPFNSIRLSFSSAIRNPTLQDQYLFYNVGRAILIGNLQGVDSLVTTESFFDAIGGLVQDYDKLEYFDVDPVRPEQVRTIEVGYKGTIAKRLFVDASYYYSWYQDFLGFQIGVELEFDSIFGGRQISNIQPYRVSANSKDIVNTQGFAAGLTYGFANYYAVTGNYSFNRLNRRGSDDPLIPAFNTPEHKFNIGISGREIAINTKRGTDKGFGFNVNYRWVQGFLFEGSPQFTGEIDTYDMLDAQVNYKIEKIFTTVKLGVTNLMSLKNFSFDNRVYTTYGGPRVGRLAYVSLLFEFDKI